MVTKDPLLYLNLNPLAKFMRNLINFLEKTLQ